MAKFGINVPDGVPAFSVKEVEDAAKKLADEKGEVRLKATCMGLGTALTTTCTSPCDDVCALGFLHSLTVCFAPWRRTDSVSLTGHWESNSRICAACSRRCSVSSAHADA